MQEYRIFANVIQVLVNDIASLVGRTQAKTAVNFDKYESTKYYTVNLNSSCGLQ